MSTNHQNDAANQAPPTASWRIFVSIDAEHAGFLPVYLVRRGSGRAPRFLLVWHVGEIRWVASSELGRARRNAGDKVVDWAGDAVRRYLAEHAFGIIDCRDDRQKGHEYEQQAP